MKTITILMDAVFPMLTGEAHRALANADVVIGVDSNSQREFTVYGMPALESTTALKKLSAMRVVRVALDCDNKELERLTALVRRLKGLDVSQPANA